VANLAQRLNREKYNPIVCSFKGGFFERTLKEQGVTVWNLKKKGGLDLTMLYRLLSRVRQEKIDVIHTHSFSANFWGRWLPLQVCRCTTEHSVATVKTKLQKFIDRLLAPYTDRIICVSAMVRHSLIVEEKLKEDKLMVLHNGIEPIIEMNRDSAYENQALYRSRLLLWTLGAPKDTYL
jgi:hypothetical protein